MNQYQILWANIKGIMWDTVRQITNEILEVKIFWTETLVQGRASSSFHSVPQKTLFQPVWRNISICLEMPGDAKNGHFVVDKFFEPLYMHIFFYESTTQQYHVKQKERKISVDVLIEIHLKFKVLSIISLKRRKVKSESIKLHVISS